MRIFLFFKILYLHFKDKEWWILYEVNNTFLNLIKVSWHDSKEAVEEYNYNNKKGKYYVKRID